jgi:hypothetical protein
MQRRYLGAMALVSFWGASLFLGGCGSGGGGNDNDEPEITHELLAREDSKRERVFSSRAAQIFPNKVMRQPTNRV